MRKASKILLVIAIILSFIIVPQTTFAKETVIPDNVIILAKGLKETDKEKNEKSTENLQGTSSKQEEKSKDTLKEATSGKEEKSTDKFQGTTSGIGEKGSMLQGTVDQDISTWNFTMDQEAPVSIIDIVGWVIRFLRNVSIILTVLVITILGIKYMIGSVEQKAEYKKAYVSIIMGVVLITTVTSIVEAIFSAAQN